MIKNLFSVFKPLRWYQNGIVLLAAVLAVTAFNLSMREIMLKLIYVILGSCFIASGNYGINEIADLETDKHHPQKKKRALSSGKISAKFVLIISFLFYIIGFILIASLHSRLLNIFITLWVLNAIFYNIKPFRLKDKPYLDFISEALNNPIRILIGWYAIVKPTEIVPSSFVLGFWFLGIFLMASKRFGEIRLLKSSKKASRYRKSLKYYTGEKLLFIMIASLGAFYYMFGAMSMKHNVDFILMLPFIIAWTIWFFHLSYDENTIVKDPERIFEKKKFLAFSLLSLFVFLYLLITKNQIMEFISK